MYIMDMTASTAPHIRSIVSVWLSVSAFPGANETDSVWRSSPSIPAAVTLNNTASASEALKRWVGPRRPPICHAPHTGRPGRAAESERRGIPVGQRVPRHHRRTLRGVEPHHRVGRREVQVQRRYDHAAHGRGPAIDVAGGDVQGAPAERVLARHPQAAGQRGRQHEALRHARTWKLSLQPGVVP